MSNLVEYWDKNNLLVTIVGSYVPRKDDFIHLKLRDKFKIRKVLLVRHEIDKTNEYIKEMFKVFLQ